jgi:hypothetical protein
MSDIRKLRTLEGLGYLAAFMIGVGGVTNAQALVYFNVLGLVFAIVVIVRLLVMNISLGYLDKLYAQEGEKSDIEEEA